MSELPISDIDLNLPVEASTPFVYAGKPYLDLGVANPTLEELSDYELPNAQEIEAKDTLLKTEYQNQRLKSFTVHGTSFHFDKTGYNTNYNAINAGIGFEFEVGQKGGTTLVAGIYDNSFGDVTPYLGLTREWQVTSFAHCGGTLGLVDYRGNLPATEIIDTISLAAQAQCRVAVPSLSKNWSMIVGFMPSHMTKTTDRVRTTEEAYEEMFERIETELDPEELGTLQYLLKAFKIAEEYQDEFDGKVKVYKSETDELYGAAFTVSFQYSFQ